MLVTLAPRLRREHEPELALALHADDGDFETAVRLGEELLAEGQDPYLLKTMARVYWGVWRETKDELWHDSWWRVDVQRNQSAAA